MSAERLREAAVAMRKQHGPEHERHAMWSAMADWLNMTADHMDPAKALDGGCEDCETDGALAVANAYLGGAS